MSHLVSQNQPTISSYGQAGGQASTVALAVAAILGVCTVSGALLYQWQRSGAVRDTWGDLLAEQEAKADLEKLGFLTTHNLQTRHVEYVSFLECGDLDEATLEILAALPYVAALDLRSCSITDEKLCHVSGLTKLSCLQLDANPITDKGLAHLRRLHRLRQLFLRGTKVSNEGLPLLARLPELNTLDFRETPVSEEGLKHLRDMPKLRWLLLTEITDAGVPHLMRMGKLDRLTVSRNKISHSKNKELMEARPRLAIQEAQ